MPKAMIAMSGGVDSTAAAILMQKKGYDCCGGFMLLGNADDPSSARIACEQIGIELRVFDFREEFERLIISDFAASYAAGLTPNPCVKCNRDLKFGLLYEAAMKLGCDKYVTGHYARIAQDEQGRFLLKKALDPKKDQSYFLYNLTSDILSHTEFPLGDTDKEAVRELVRDLKLSNADKPDSQDICFVPDGDYASVVLERLKSPCPAGDFTDTEGNVLGRHKGIIHYTVGQRRGLGISSSERYYVKKIDVDTNRVILCRDPELFDTCVKVKETVWSQAPAPKEAFRCTAKIRYRHTPAPALAMPMPDNTLVLHFDEPVRAATAGQSAVLYDGDILLGGGIISYHRHWSCQTIRPVQ